MNQINAKYTSKIFIQYKVNPFDIRIYGSRVVMQSIGKELSIDILGRKSTPKLYELLTDIESLLFFYLGSFPRMVSLKINGDVKNISERVGKYHTSSNFLKQNLVICDITANTISEHKIQELKQMNQLALFSLQFLVSESYDHVITNHKMTLLLHVVQGIYDNNRCVQDKQTIKNKYLAATGSVGDYMASVYWLCNEYFFKYHRKFGCGILPLLKVNQYQLLCRLTDTRNWYSHFLAESRKPLRIKKGKDFIIYFEILCYAIRLAVIDKLGEQLDERRIQEFYYTVHDWILAIMYDKEGPLKSKTYMIAQAWEEFKQEIEHLEADTSTTIEDTNANYQIASPAHLEMM